MIDLDLVTNAFGLAVSLLIPVILVALLAGVLAGLIRAFFNLDDDIFGVAFRALAIGGLIYLSGPLAWQQIEDFTASMWAESESYH